MKRSYVLLVIGAILSASVGLFAQVETGAITGQVLDSTGAVVPEAEIRVVSIDTGVARTMMSDMQGNYSSPPLRPGRYRVEVTKLGFQRAVDELRLDVNQRVRVDIQLIVGEVTQTVMVSGSAALLSTESAAIGNVRGEREIQDLPLNGRNFVQLIHLVPGVNSAGGGTLYTYTGSNRQGVQGASVNGARPTNNNFLFDGIQSQDTDQNVLAFMPNVEAVQEFKVQTNAMDAQFGRNGGGTINLVLKSGTNQFHGSAFEFLRNSAMDAKNFFDQPGKTPPFRMNQFGFTAGGPVVLPSLYDGRDRTFFFGSYQGRRIRQTQTFINTVPTAAFREGDFSAAPQRIFDPATTRPDPNQAGRFLRDPFPGNRIPSDRFNPTARNLIALYPQPNLQGVANNLFFDPVVENDTTQFDLRGDHHFRSGDQFFTRYSYSDTFVIQPGQLPAPAIGACCGRPGITNTRGQQIVLGYTKVLRPNLTYEFRGGFTRLAVDVRGFTQDRPLAQELGIPGVNVDPVLWGLPQITISGFTGLGEQDFVPFLKFHNNYQYIHSVVYNRGSHTIKTGFDMGRRQGNYLSPPGPLGLFSFSGQFTQNPAAAAGTGIAMSDFLLGVYQNARVDVQPKVGHRRWELFTYFQDDWKVTSRLTVNLGMRWEVVTPWTEVADRQSNFVLNLGNVFPVRSPEIPGRTITNRELNNIGPRVGIAYRLNAKTVVRTGYGLFYSFPGIATGRLPSQAPPFAGNIPINNNAFNYESARRISDGFPLDRPPIFDPTGRNFKYWVPNDNEAYMQQWNFNLQREFWNSVFTAGYVASKGNKLYIFPNVNQAVPGSAPVAQRRPFPNLADGDGLSRLGNSSYHSLQLSFDRRLTAGLSLLGAYTWSHSIDDSSNDAGGGPQNVRNIRAERGSSDFDVRHRLVISSLYEIGLGRSLRGVPAAFLKGWQMGGIATFQTGAPFTPAMVGGQNTLGSGVGSQRPDRLRDGTLSASERSIQRWFDVTAFAAPAPFTFGNSPRNASFGPGTKQVDFSAAKQFRLGSSDTAPTLQYRAEFFNLFNTPQFNNPNATIGSPQAGTITSAGDKILLVRTSRQIQMALVFRF
jgi:hypothetical protein